MDDDVAALVVDNGSGTFITENNHIGRRKCIL